MRLENLSEADQIALAIRRSIEDIKQAKQLNGSIPSDIAGAIDVRSGGVIAMLANVIPGFAHINHKCVNEALTFLNTCACDRYGNTHALFELPMNGSGMPDYVSAIKSIGYVIRRMGFTPSIDAIHAAIAMHTFQAKKLDPKSLMLFFFTRSMTMAQTYVMLGARLGRDITAHVYSFITKRPPPEKSLADIFRMYKELSVVQNSLMLWVMSLGIPRSGNGWNAMHDGVRRIRKTYVSDFADVMSATGKPDAMSELAEYATSDGLFDVNIVRRDIFKSKLYSALIELTESLKSWGFKGADSFAT